MPHSSSVQTAAVPFLLLRELLVIPPLRLRMLQQFDQLYAQFKEAGVDNEATFGGYRLVYINVPEEDRPRRKRTHDIELYLPGETTNPLRSVKAARAHLSGTVGTPMSATEAPGAAVAMEAGADAPSLAMDEDGDEAGSAGELERPNVAVEALLAIDRARGDGCKRRLMDGNLLYVHVTEEGVEWMLHIMQREGVRVIRDLKTLGEFYGVTGDVRKAAALREEFCARPGVRGGRPDSPSLAFLVRSQPQPPQPHVPTTHPNRAGVRPAGPSYRIPRSSNSRGEVQAVHLQAEGRPAALWAPHLPPLRRRVALCRTVQLRQVPHVPHRLRRQRAGHAGVGEGGAGTAPHRAKPRVRRDVRRPRILPSSRARGRAVAAAEAQRAGVSVWRACKERENSAKKHWKRVGCGAGSVSMLV